MKHNTITLYEINIFSNKKVHVLITPTLFIYVLA